jgi:hypothetical protein
MSKKEELTDVEERRKYDERVQKDYEEIKYRNRELRKRQQQGKQLEIPGLEEKGEEKTFLDEGSAFRTLTGLGVEIGGNFFLDAFSFVPGSQQVGSAGLNYLQQVIRGGPISKGEILAAAAASQIPFLQQARTIKKGGKLIREAKNLSRGGKFVRSVARGSTAGAIDSTVRPIIDEKRAPTVGEFTTGVTAGGAFGGMFDLAPAFTKGGTKKLGQEIKEITKDGQKFLGDLTDAITPGPVRVMQGDLIGAAKFGGTSGSAKGKKARTYPVTKARDLALYGAEDDMFEEVPDLLTAVQEGAPRGGRYVKIVDKFGGDTYHTVFTRAGKTQVLPYNTWYAKNVNPFMVPKALITKLKKFEGGQQGNLLKVTQTGTKLTQANPGGLPTVKVPVGTKGKFKTVVAPTKFSKGTVDEFNNWYKGVFKLQKEEQALNRQVSIMLEKLGNIQARNPGKKVFDTDLSHIAPRSKGGSGLTFQEAWILNQQRGATDILDEKLLAAAGIPKNWEELFYYWLAQKKPGRELQTAIGPLSQINVDDYFALAKGQALNVVGKRRKDIRNLVNRQIGNKETYRLRGKRGTIQDDFEAAIRASKAGQVGGDIFLNDKLLDLRWVAENFDDLLEIGDI